MLLFLFYVNNVLLGDTCKEIGVTRHNSDNAATVLTA
jgi:hypothetical protein